MLCFEKLDSARRVRVVLGPRTETFGQIDAVIIGCEV